jgi:hypothetical protein
VLLDTFLYKKVIDELIVDELGLDLASVDDVLTYFFCDEEIGRCIDEILRIGYLFAKSCPTTERSSHY